MFWRASSNFVYAFEHEQHRYFLRFSYEQERSIEQITAEIEYIEYLKAKKYLCVSPIMSVNGKYVENMQQPEGTYCAVMFQAAAGAGLGESIPEEQCEEPGKVTCFLASVIERI